LEFLTDSLELGAFIALVVLGPLILQVAALYFATRQACSRLVKAFGWRALLLISWIGTPVHELSHALVVLLLGGKLKEVSLFSANSATGELGSVSYTFKSSAPIRRTVVALAPLVGGTAVLLAVTRLLFPDVMSLAWEQKLAFSKDSLLELPLGLASALGENFVGLVKALTSRAVVSRWQTWLWVYLVVCIGTRLSPSRVDFKHIWKFFAIAIPVCFLAGLLLVTMKNHYGTIRGPLGAARYKGVIAKSMMTVNSCFSLTLLLCLSAALLVFFVSFPFVKRRAGHH